MVTFFPLISRTLKELGFTRSFQNPNDQKNSTMPMEVLRCWSMGVSFLAGRVLSGIGSSAMRDCWWTLLGMGGIGKDQHSYNQIMAFADLMMEPKGSNGCIPRHPVPPPRLAFVSGNRWVCSGCNPENIHARLMNPNEARWWLVTICNAVSGLIEKGPALRRELARSE